MNDIELALSQIASLARKIEKYFEILSFDSELDFILKGKYEKPSELEKIIDGSYTIAN